MASNGYLVMSGGGGRNKKGIERSLAVDIFNLHGGSIRANSEGERAKRELKIELQSKKNNSTGFLRV